ncbi:MAG: hypothetical protein WC310_01940 [Patescibacteria group bacterium]|jgi:hypothetical protein
MATKIPTFLLIIVGIFLPVSFLLTANITGDYKYAWSNNTGYINFESVTISDSALTGYAWSKNFGWIRFDPPNGGVLNDNGDLSGYAWGDQLGWINFGSVSINTSNGKFSGTATGDLIGTMTFDCPTYCDVRTDWRPACPVVSNAATYNAYPTCGPATCNSGYIVSGGSCVATGGGGGSGGSPSAPTTPIEPSSPTEPISENPINPNNEPSTEPSINKEMQIDGSLPKSTSENSQPTSENITQFFKGLQKQLPTDRPEENHQESFNAPLAVEPQQSGLLVWDFTTPEMAQESKRQAVIIELPKEVSADILTVSVRLATADTVASLQNDQTTLLGTVFDITAVNKQGQVVHQFDKPIKITLVIPENLRDRNDLGVYYLDDDSNEWKLVSDAIFDDVSATFYVNHLTHFAIFAAVGIPETISMSLSTSHLFLWFYVLVAVIAVIWFIYSHKKQSHNK